MAVYDGENVRKSALTAHLIDKIGYLPQKTQAKGSFPCMICKKVAKRLR
jgi:ABC-type Mn2+/Zn2+ transport system ATPase subunit